MTQVEVKLQPFVLYLWSGTHKHIYKKMKLQVILAYFSWINILYPCSGCLWEDRWCAWRAAGASFSFLLLLRFFFRGRLSSCSALMYICKLCCLYNCCVESLPYIWQREVILFRSWCHCWMCSIKQKGIWKYFPLVCTPLQLLQASYYVTCCIYVVLKLHTSLVNEHQARFHAKLFYHCLLLSWRGLHGSSFVRLHHK